MKNNITTTLLALFICILSFSMAHATSATPREKEFENKEVTVWKTVIEPHQPLAMHRHDHPRVVVALTNVDLTVTNDRGQSHKLVMKKGTARFLNADKPKELHCDINNSNHPMEVMVIEFKK